MHNSVNFNIIFKNKVDTNKILDQAILLSGDDNPSIVLLIALVAVELLDKTENLEKEIKQIKGEIK